LSYPDFRLIALAAALVLLGVSRAREVAVSRRNEQSMRRRGGYEAPMSLMPLFVILHTAAPLGLIVEVAATNVRPGPLWPLWPLWLGVWIAAEWIRAASMRALGDRWSVRIFVVPGEPPIKRGPYRFVAHPIYIAVALELAAFPLLFGAWRTAICVAIANAALLAVRIRFEGRALRESEAPPFDPARQSR
jgi:methyltransferase